MPSSSWIREDEEFRDFNLLKPSGQKVKDSGRLDHWKDLLGLIDIEAFAKYQYSIAGTTRESSNLGPRGPALHTLLVGKGASYSVRRAPLSAFWHSISIWDENFDKNKAFVAVKQPLLDRKERMTWNAEDDSARRLYSVMLELKILFHEPIRQHPNIVRLHHFLWDTQNHADAIAPSLILEYAEFGPLDEFQTASLLGLHANTKIKISLDVAEGLAFLHRCGIVHGDVKSQ